MSDGAIELGATLQLGVAVPGFRSEREAASLDWSRRVAVPAGAYTVERAGRSEAGLVGDGKGDAGRYYEIVGPVRAWVRENYLLAARHGDWPWEMVHWVGPIDWNAVWEAYLRMRVEGRTPPSPVRSVAAPASSAPPADRSSGEARRTDEYGVTLAKPGSWLPDFDDAFDLADELDLAGAG